GFNLPLLDPDRIKIAEPGDVASTTQIDQVRMTGGFDWTVTDAGDVHFIGTVRDDENNEVKQVHSYQSGGTGGFVTTTDFSGGAAIYTAGNDVYLIGLNSSRRVKVEKAPGGTNDFSTVYEATTGTRFTHGQVHIANGKLYYYLMENAPTGSARPIHLQVIDLGIAPTPPRDLTGTYHVRNLASGTYMESEDGEVILSPLSNGEDQSWRLVRVQENYYNIASALISRGVLRAAPDSQVINTLFASPTEDTDKLWKAIHQWGNVYRFESKVPDRDYLWAKTASGGVLWGPSLENDTRWGLEELTLTNIDPDHKNAYTWYPNPATSYVLLEQIQDVHTLRILDLAGREVLRQSLPSGTSTWKLSVESLPAGVYYLQLINSESLVSEKLLIE
ncbi:MAG: T9SS type A sorting domain-containing protein, partial [Bacteroidota bacterium]